ncbi:MAG: hypothetical protein ACYSW4_00850 [Planctomycetota bacterium]
MERSSFCSQADKPAGKPREGRGFTPLKVRLPPRLPTQGGAAGSERRHRDSAGLVLTGLTLVEVLVVLGVISVLMGILLPAFEKVRYQARTLVGMSNQRQTVNAVSLFAIDNDGRYPESVATIGAGSTWHWQEPTMMTACKESSPELHRSMSAYLRRYIKDASIMFCPNAPYKYKYLQESWDAGEDWNNPETMPIKDPVLGIYCFYWNYTGYLGEEVEPFRGPLGPSYRRGQSKLLVSDYFGYYDGRSPNAYSSCERFKGVDITEGSDVSSAYWSRLKSNGNISPETLRIKLHAGYTDGHVESFRSSEAVPMKVIMDKSTNAPYPYWLGKGDFYLPRNALH